MWYRLQYGITEEQFLNALSEYNSTFLKESSINFYDEYLKITII